MGGASYETRLGPDLGDRIGDLTYDVGDPHIELATSPTRRAGPRWRPARSAAVDFGGGCYREEVVRTNGSEERVVSLDTQPCVECGTCAVVADTDWSHPRGDKGVEFKWGDPVGDEWPTTTAIGCSPAGPSRPARRWSPTRRTRSARWTPSGRVRRHGRAVREARTGGSWVRFSGAEFERLDGS